MKRLKKKITREEEMATALLKAILTIQSIREELEASNDAAAPLADQLFHWHRVRQFYDAIKAVANEAEALSRHMSYTQLPEAFRKSRGARTLILDGIGRFSLSSRTTAKVLDWDRAGAWLKIVGRDDALRMMMPASTMNATVAEVLKAGTPDPDPEKDGINATTVSYTSFTKD